MIDFFISYQQTDRSWAEWIAWHLEENGYTTTIQAWDFRPGSSFPIEMDKAATDSQRTIIVLSSDYLANAFTQPEWAAAFAQDPEGTNRKLLPIRIRDCKPSGLLVPIVYIDLVEINDEAKAVSSLLAGVKKERVKPTNKPFFPPHDAKDKPQCTPYFPNAPIATLKEKYATLMKLEFETVKDRLANPVVTSKCAELLFGAAFPFGTKKVIPQISKCAVAYDIHTLLDATVGNFKIPEFRFAGSFAPHIVYKAASCRWRLLVAIVADGLENFQQNVVVNPLFSGIESHDFEKNVTFNLRELVRQYVSRPSAAQNFTVPMKLLRLIGVLCRQHAVMLEDLVAEEQKKYRHQAFRSQVPISEHPTENTATVRVYFYDHEGTYEKLLRAIEDRHMNIIWSRSFTLLPHRVAYAELHVSHSPNIELSKELAFMYTKTSPCEEVYTFECDNTTGQLCTPVAG